MGHVRLGILPRTRAWKEVVGLIADGCDVEEVAGAVLTASDRAFQAVQKDAGFSDALTLLTQLAIAAKKSDPAAHLTSAGLNLSPQSSVAEVAAAIHKALDAKSAQRREHSDFAELAQNALVGGVVKHLDEGLGRLVTPSAAEVHKALAKLGRPAEFGRLARTFFDRLSRDCIGYFLSKTLGSHVGEGHRFATASQVAEFERAMAQHTHEASEIVERYSSEWFSKHRHEGGGDISAETSGHFGWYAMEKMRKELKARSQPDAP